MNERSPIEARVGALISAYADMAPTEVDHAAIARFAATSPPPRRSVRHAYAPPGLALGFVLLVLALAIGLIGGSLLAGGDPFRRAPEELLSEGVAPFVGLPPEGAEPSAPQTGELVVGFGGRVDALALEHYRMWLYDDGRLIWTGEQGAGGRTRPYAIVEQRLTREGVDLVRARIAAGVTSVVGTTAVSDGVLWGSMTVGDDGQLLDVGWDARLVGELTDPAAWLPASAWADQRIRAYVPSSYAVCAWLDGQASSLDERAALDRLPNEVKALVYRTGTRMADTAPGWPLCYEVPTEAARSIAATLGSMGHKPDESNVGPRYELLTDGIPRQGLGLELLPITPHGEIVCNCG